MVLLTAITLTLSFDPSRTVFTKTPPITAKWEIPSSNNSYHLGEVIKATIRVTTQPGATVDTEKLPNVGDVLSLPAKIDNSKERGHYYDVPPMIEEGELEIISRQISQYTQEDGRLVTEIEYGLMYLLPIDLALPADDKRLPYYVPVNQEYLLATRSGEIKQVSSGTFVDMTNFFIITRVDENSQPFIEFFKLTLPATRWPQVRLAGFSLISLAFVFPIGRIISLLMARQHQKSNVVKPPNVNEMFQRWCTDPDPFVFIETLKLYRQGVWDFPKSPEKRLKIWLRTTFILYSGITLNQKQMEDIFRELVKEISDDSA